MGDLPAEERENPKARKVAEGETDDCTHNGLDHTGLAGLGH